MFKINIRSNIQIELYQKEAKIAQSVLIIEENECESNRLNFVNISPPALICEHYKQKLS